MKGCSHGSLSAIYDSIARYEAAKSTKVDLLLLCGDFQALRSRHDFASLAVPPKYHALGTFHEYYAGTRVAPVLTLVIGGNHEASNYMWELYHGGWLAPNIYYLGAAGCVRVDGLRIVGASGIYKDHDFGKGHHEKVPYDRSTLRSVYHIRSYDVAKLMQPTVFMSHDWPISIAKYGDLRALLQRKPFFRSEIEDNTLGSPPLLNLLKHIQPAYWFAAHLHVKFAAVFRHAATAATPLAPMEAESGSSAPARASISASRLPVPAVAAGNPDEIAISDDEELPSAPPAVPTATATVVAAANPDEIAISDDEDGAPLVEPHERGTMVGNGGPGNPDEIAIDDDFDDFADEHPGASGSAVAAASGSASAVRDAVAVDESMDVAQAARAAHVDVEIGAPRAETAAAMAAHAGEAGEGLTRFLALDKCGPGKDFIQFLDIAAPAPSPTPGAPRLTFDHDWLAVTRALHPYLSLTLHQRPLPPSWEIQAAVRAERDRIQREGLLVPALPAGDGAQAEAAEGGPVELVWDKGEVDVGRVQQFWPTAPAEGQPGGSPDAWYTNPQTEAFCGMLGIENKINPAPPTPPVAAS